MHLVRAVPGTVCRGYGVGSRAAQQPPGLRIIDRTPPEARRPAEVSAIDDGGLTWTRGKIPPWYASHAIRGDCPLYSLFL